MEVLLMLIMAASNILCFYVGAKVGQKVVKGEEVEIPAIHPMEAIREHQERREAERKHSMYETIMQNIDNYDGTANGQKDIPGR
jgi:hypothetical protein